MGNRDAMTRTLYTDGIPVTVTDFTYTCDDDNRLTIVRYVISGTAYIKDFGYDNNGNMISKTEYPEDYPSQAIPPPTRLMT